MTPPTPMTSTKARALIEEIFETQIRSLDLLAKKLEGEAFFSPRPAFLQFLKVEEQRDRLVRNLDDFRNQISPSRTSDEPVEGKGSLKSLWNSEKFQDGLQFGLYMLVPFAIPLNETGTMISDRLHLPDFLMSGLQFLEATFERSAEIRKQREAELEGAIRNPSDLEEFQNGTLFVVEEEAANELIGKLMGHSKKSKVRNLVVKIDDDRLKISGEYDTWVGWVDFKAQLRFELRDGEVDGKLNKVEAVGIDLTNLLEGDILKAFRQFGIEPPKGAKIDDLSWVTIPGIRRIEIDRGRIIIAREPAPIGPS